MNKGKVNKVNKIKIMVNGSEIKREYNRNTNKGCDKGELKIRIGMKMNMK